MGGICWLSFAVGAGEQGLAVWHLHEGSWTRMQSEFVYSEAGVLSIAVSEFSGYAVTAVPEPSMAVVGGVVLAWVVGRRRR